MTVHVHGSISLIEKLKIKLLQEIEKNEIVSGTIQNLVKYHINPQKPAVAGLEHKLDKAGKQDQLTCALYEKEQFAKFLEEWSLYASAQEIFVYLLGRIDHEFQENIIPQIGKVDSATINQLITDRIVNPIIQECGVETFMLTHSLVRGMMYWLAELCYVRWHQ